MSGSQAEYLLIWDVDGTLIRAKGLGKASLEKAFSALYGIEGAMRDINLSGMVDTMILKMAWDCNGIPYEKRNIQEYFDVYLKVLEEGIRQSTESYAMPGIFRLMDGLAEDRRFYSVLGTGNIEKGARLKLSFDNLNRYFRSGGFAEDADDSGERAPIIESAAAKARQDTGKVFERRNIFVIGDTPKDIGCGKALDFRTIAVATGMFGADDLRKCGPDFLFGDFSDTGAFTGIFEGFNQNIPSI